LAHAGFDQPVEWGNGFRQVDPSSSHKFTFQETLQLFLDHVIILLTFIPFSIVKLIPFGYFKKATEITNEWNLYLQEMVTERTRSMKETNNNEGSTKLGITRGNDLFTNLINAVQAKENPLNSSTLVYLHESELYANLFLFILAGHETTAGTLSYSLTLLALHPEIQEKLYQETIQVIGKNKEPTFEDLSKLVYVQCIMKETLRLFPIVTSLIKEAVQNTNITIPKSFYNGNNKKEEEKEEKLLHIPKGTQIVLNVAALHYNPKYWVKPEKFIPDRFDLQNGHKIQEDILPLSSTLKDKKETQDDRTQASEHELPYNRYAWLPFSEGHRSCIGRRFSEVEFMTILTLIIQKYSIHLSSKMNPQTVLLSTRTITLRPANPIELVFRKR